MELKKVIKVIFIDLMGVVLGILNGFIIPKFLNIDAYVYIKTFALYIGYSGILHLGFSDGMYILLGGKNITDIGKEKIKGYLIVVMKLVTIILIAIYILNILIIKDPILNWFIIYTFPFQIILFFSLLFRATGELEKYTKIRIGINAFQLCATLSVLIVSSSPILYIIIQIIGQYVVGGILLINLFKSKNQSEKIEFLEIKKLIKVGFLIMIANTANNLIYSLDRWVVKLNFSNVEFAYYSFGVSMLSFFIVLIGSLTIVFYPYIAKDKGNAIGNKIRKCILLITSFAPVGYFIIEMIVKVFLPQYINSLEVLGILILTIPFMSVINIVYSNFYKILGLGKKYLQTCLKILALGLILNLVGISVWKNINVIAIASLATLIIWYFYSSTHFQNFTINIKEKIYIVVYVLLYYGVSIYDIGTFVKITIFIIGMVLCALVCLKEEVGFLKIIILEKVKSSKG